MDEGLDEEKRLATEQRSVISFTCIEICTFRRELLSKVQPVAWLSEAATAYGESERASESRVESSRKVVHSIDGPRLASC